MSKKILIPLVALILLLAAGVGYLLVNLNKQQAANKEMQELAELDKKEMENEYEQFTRQYSEMKTQINNDSIIEQLTQEQLRTQQLLDELKRVKNSDAREIARLKKELATVRAVLRNFVIQIDSLNRLNENLKHENSQIKEQYNAAARQVAGLTDEKASLSQKVAIAAQLNATNISMAMLKDNGKAAKKLRDCKKIQVAFRIARNVTAQNGQRTVYVRITTPTGETLRSGGTFPYENRNLDYSMQKTIEYSGEETGITLYWSVKEFLSAGQYTVNIFADGHNIGTQSFSFK